MSRLKHGHAVALVVMVLLVIAWIGTRAIRKLRPPSMPSTTGQVIVSTRDDWGTIVLDESHCVLVNNVWNKAAAPRGFEQEVFVQDLDGKKEPGWRWRSGWQFPPAVVSQPQLVCGDKPWDKPRYLIRGFPFRVGTKRITANFDIRMQASGNYNMAFSLWAVRSLPPSRDVISHEIMIWNFSSGQRPAGQKEGSLAVNGTTYDVFLERQHADASGSNAITWTYVAFVPRSPVLHGPLELTDFTSYLVAHKLLSTDSYLTSVEFGNEVTDGTGIVELSRFSLEM